jgi:ABC-type glycerol-3-phosphate transport system permease component
MSLNLTMGRKGLGKDWSKHLILLALLAVELLPLYMMLQISVKDNSEFLLNPWLPSAPANWHWSNLTEGFNMIFPYIPLHCYHGGLLFRAL